MTKNIMTRVVSSCMPCLLLFIALPNGSPQVFAEARAKAQAQSYIRTPSSSSSSQHEWLSPPKEHTVLKANNNNNNNNNNELLTTQSALADLDMTTANTTTTNTTTTNTTSQSPTPPPAPTSPTPPPTSFPTKKYESPEDEKEEEKKESKVGGILGWIVLALLVVGCVYFRDAIIFFLVNVWNSTRRYGCKGCLKSCFPWFFGSELAGGTGGGEPLDQIIFEAEDPTAPLMS